jgi:multidrug/hemolysin transport system permease protein
MIAFAKRNILLFFRDKSAVFFSLLAVFIIIGLYALFLGEVWTSSLTEIENPRFLMDSWIMAGLIAVTSITTTMGAFGIMVDDRTRKITKDFYSSPVKKSSIAGGYIISSYIIGVIMSIVALVLAEIYIVVNGGEILPLLSFIKIFALILLSTLTNTSIVLFVVSFFKSQNAFATASTIMGTLIGFLTGIYLPVGNLPEAVQFVVKIFPVSHGASLFRKVMMEIPLNRSFEKVPAGYLEEFNEMMGVTFTFGNYKVASLVSIFILIITSLIFYGLAILNMSRKKEL